MKVKFKKVNFLSVETKSFKGADGKPVSYYPIKILTPDNDLLEATTTEDIFNNASLLQRLDIADVEVDIRTFDGKMKTKVTSFIN